MSWDAAGCASGVTVDSGVGVCGQELVIAPVGRIFATTIEMGYETICAILEGRSQT